MLNIHIVYELVKPGKSLFCLHSSYIFIIFHFPAFLGQFHYTWMHWCSGGVVVSVVEKMAFLNEFRRFYIFHYTTTPLLSYSLEKIDSIIYNMKLKIYKR